jgi:hypothetical protein
LVPDFRLFKQPSTKIGFAPDGSYKQVIYADGRKFTLIYWQSVSGFGTMKIENLIASSFRKFPV